MASIGRLMERAQDRLLREPRREDRSVHILMICAGCFLLFTSLDEGPSVKHVSVLAVLTLVALGAAESVPVRWHTVAVVLRVVSLLVWVAGVSILLAGLIGIR